MSKLNLEETGAKVKASSSKQPDVYEENERFIQEEEEEMEVEKPDLEKEVLELASNIRKKRYRNKRSCYADKKHGSITSRNDKRDELPIQIPRRSVHVINVGRII